MARVAVVDDDKALCETLARQLAEAGHECVVESRGVRAFDTLKGARPDVVLLDLMMSGVSGFRLCRMVRKDPILYAVPVIVIACAGDEPEVAYCKKLGADESVVKPIAVNELMGKVQTQLVSIEEAKRRDAATGLPGLEAIRRELNHKLARGERVAACYLGVVNLKEIMKGRAEERDAVNELAREVAHVMYQVAERLQIYEMLVGYVGSAHFVVILKPDEHEHFCKRFIRAFDSGLAVRWKRGRLTPGHGGDTRKGGKPAAPRVSIGVVHNLNREYTSADTLLMMLAQVQREAQDSPTSSYLVCKCPVPL